MHNSQTVPVNTPDIPYMGLAFDFWVCTHNYPPSPCAELSPARTTTRVPPHHEYLTAQVIFPGGSHVHDACVLMTV